MLALFHNKHQHGVVGKCSGSDSRSKKRFVRLYLVLIFQLILKELYAACGLSLLVTPFVVVKIVVVVVSRATLSRVFTQETRGGVCKQCGTIKKIQDFNYLKSDEKR